MKNRKLTFIKLHHFDEQTRQNGELNEGKIQK